MGHAPPRGKAGPPTLPPPPPRKPGSPLEGEVALAQVRRYYLLGRFGLEEFEVLVGHVLRGGTITEES